MMATWLLHKIPIAQDNGKKVTFILKKGHSRVVLYSLLLSSHISQQYL